MAEDLVLDRDFLEPVRDFLDRDLVLAHSGLRPGSEQAEELLLGGDLCLLLLMKMAMRLMVRMRRTMPTKVRLIRLDLDWVMLENWSTGVVTLRLTDTEDWKMTAPVRVSTCLLEQVKTDPLCSRPAVRLNQAPASLSPAPVTLSPAILQKYSAAGNTPSASP